jgi:UMF1 family MFS transporter
MLPAMSTPPDRARAQRAWCLYDWANSAFTTCVVAALLPVWFARGARLHLAPHDATALWGYGSATALALAALLSPLIGARADRTGRRKPLLVACTVIGAAATAALALLPFGAWSAQLVLHGIAFVAFACANVLYDALLPAVAAPHELDRVSSRGFAWGYLGGGLVLAVALLLVSLPTRLGLPDAAAGTRLAFALVAVWWLGFSLPLLRDVPEPPPAAPREPGTRTRLLDTLRSLRRSPDLLTFLLAFWLYSDGIGTIVRMATLYGAELGLADRDLLGALLLVQFLAAPASLAFGRLAGPLGARGAVLVGLAGYMGITLFAFTLHSAWQFWTLAALVALFQGGTQALSRSLFATLVPRERTGELFGFYSVSEKLAGVAGPLMFAAVTQATGGARWATLSLLPLFLGGAWLLSRVDLERGRAAAAGLGPTPPRG